MVLLAKIYSSGLYKCKKSSKLLMNVLRRLSQVLNGTDAWKCCLESTQLDVLVSKDPELIMAYYFVLTAHLMSDERVNIRDLTTLCSRIWLLETCDALRPQELRRDYVSSFRLFENACDYAIRVAELPPGLKVTTSNEPIFRNLVPFLKNISSSESKGNGWEKEANIRSKRARECAKSA